MSWPLSNLRPRAEPSSTINEAEENVPQVPPQEPLDLDPQVPEVESQGDVDMDVDPQPKPRIICALLSRP